MIKIEEVAYKLFILMLRDIPVSKLAGEMIHQHRQSRGQTWFQIPFLGKRTLNWLISLKRDDTI